MNTFNGAAVVFKDIPVLSPAAFRQEVLTLCMEEDARLINLFGLPEENGAVRLISLLGFGEEARVRIVSTIIPADAPFFPSLTPDLVQAHNFEREIAEQWAITPEGHPWLKPLRRHANYRGVADLWPSDGAGTPGESHGFYRVEGTEVHEIGVGPVHAGIIEPGHFRFQCHGEKILHLEIMLGYQHRGIELLMGRADSKRAAWLSEAVAGDTSVGHAIAFCEVSEALASCLIPPRAQAIRIVALEIERLANHVGDMGALGMDAGFMPTSAWFGRMRGDYLNLLLMLTGNRFGKGLCRPGGVLFDIEAPMAEEMCRRLRIYRKEFQETSELLFTRPSVLARFEDIGALTLDDAKRLGMVGPAARACGLERDVRINYSSGMWQFHHIPISLAATGDVYARALVRRQEVQRSIEFLLRILPSLPKGNIFTPPSAFQPGKLAFSMVEAWRGEAVHVGISDADGRLMRYKIKDPSFHNWFALALAMRGQEVSDFPLCNKSFNLSYCGHDL